MNSALLPELSLVTTNLYIICTKSLCGQRAAVRCWLRAKQATAAVGAPRPIRRQRAPD